MKIYLFNSSDRALLTASGPSHNSFCNRTGHGVINLGSVPSLLDCPKLPIRAYSAKHSVITLEECSNDGQIYNNDNKIIRQISRRRRSSACEQAILSGGGVAAASTVPFVGNLSKQHVENEKR